MLENEKEKLVTIIVPVYNVENYLNKCIETLVNQTYKNIEIILVNDGSTDKSLIICQKWEKNDRRIKIINKKNGGLSSARNAGIKKASGKYIMFVDSDDFVDEKIIELLLKNILSNNSDIAICNRFYLYENGKIELKYKDENIVKVMTNVEAITELNSFNLFDMSAWAKLYKLSLFKRIKFPEGKLCEDYYIMYKLFDSAKIISYISTPLYYYLQRKGSISKNKNPNMDFIMAAKEQMLYLDSKYPNIKQYSHTAYALSFMTVYNQCKINGGEIEEKLQKEFKKNVKKNLGYILKNKKIKLVRKIQSLLFVYSKSLYIYLIQIINRR